MFNLVVDLGYVVESRAILVLWFALAILAFAHMHLQVPLAGALDRATFNCLRASLLPMAILLDSPFAQAILPNKRRTLSMVDPYYSASLPRAHSYEHTQVTTEIKAMALAAVDPTYYRTLRDKKVGYHKVTVKQLLDHFKDECGKLTAWPLCPCKPLLRTQAGQLALAM